MNRREVFGKLSASHQCCSNVGFGKLSRRVRVRCCGSDFWFREGLVPAHRCCGVFGFGMFLPARSALVLCDDFGFGRLLTARNAQCIGAVMGFRVGRLSLACIGAVVVLILGFLSALIGAVMIFSTQKPLMVRVGAVVVLVLENSRRRTLVLWEKIIHLGDGFGGVFRTCQYIRISSR